MVAIDGGPYMIDNARGFEMDLVGSHKLYVMDNTTNTSRRGGICETRGLRRSRAWLFGSKKQALVRGTSQIVWSNPTRGYCILHVVYISETNTNLQIYATQAQREGVDVILKTACDECGQSVSSPSHFDRGNVIALIR